MKRNTKRPMHSLKDAGDFLINCLGINGHEHICHSGAKFSNETISQKIRDVEGVVLATDDQATLNSQSNRVPSYRSDANRETLRKTIFEELATLPRLDNDDDLELGIGGALPLGARAKNEAKAYIVIGLPASGKSALVNEISDKLGAIILDADYAKRKLPEFNGTPAGANLVHKESSAIIWGGQTNEPNLFGYCTETKQNVVVPTIGENYKGLNELCDTFIKADYEVHLITTTLSREISTIRALERFLVTGRYVPLSLIFDTYANDPQLNYYKMRVEAMLKGTSKWSSFGAISTLSKPHVIEDCSNDSSPVKLLELKK